MNQRGRVDLAIYGTAFAKLIANPWIVAFPLLAAAIDLLCTYWGNAVTDPLGGMGNGIIGLIVQIFYLYAFGVAIIAAQNALRGYSNSLSGAWNEARRKGQAILLAAIGFQFVVWIAAYLGSLLGIPNLALVLQLVAYFFLILTIPAAAIGGAPGGYALSASIRTVRANVVPCLILAIAFAVLWVGVPELLTIYGSGLGVFGFDIVLAIARAIVLAYLAFPFAAVYDEVGARLW